MPSKTPLPSLPASHTHTTFHPQEQTTRLSQRCLPSERPSATTLTRRPPRSRHPLTIPTPTLVPLGFYPPSGLAPCLGPVPDPLTSALPSSRDRQCLVQASVIHNKGKATGICLVLCEADRARPRDRLLRTFESTPPTEGREQTKWERGWIGSSASSTPTFKKGGDLKDRVSSDVRDSRGLQLRQRLKSGHWILQ